MKVGVILPLGSGLATGDRAFLSALGAALERHRVESVWVPEHALLFDRHGSRYPFTPDGSVPIPPDSGLLDPFVALSFLAACTERVRLATGVCLLAQRNPVYTAKQVADLDVLSGGRAELGVGLGWLREEYEALGVPWDARGRRTDDYLQVLKALWTEPVSGAATPSFTLPASRMYPKPLQRPHPPIVIGGTSGAALRRVAHHGDGWFAMGLRADAFAERVQRLERELADAGRERSDITISVSPTAPADVAALREYGADRLIVPVVPAGADQLDAALAPLTETAA